MKENIHNKYDFITINDSEIPILISLEHRNGLRVSFGSNAVIVRLPIKVSNLKKNELYDSALRWIRQKCEDKPELMTSIKLTDYEKKSILVMEDKYNIILKKTDNKVGKIDVKNSNVVVQVPFQMNKFNQSVVTKKLLSKLFSKIYLAQVKKEVYAKANSIGTKKVNNIRLKYNKTNWGSCSSKGNINLSSRLLLVPYDVRQYIIVHELAHLFEMNHSPKFWSIVYKNIPKFKTHENWLNRQGRAIDF